MLEKHLDHLKVGDHFTYKRLDTDPRLHRITAISADLKSLTLAATTAVSGVNVATLNDQDDISGVRKAVPVIQDEGNGLFAQLENKNVSDVSLTNSDLSIKTQITGVALVQLVYSLQTSRIQI